MPLFIEPTEQPSSFRGDFPLTLPPQAIEHGAGLEHNPHYDAPSVPEPAEYSLVFGALLVGLAIWKRVCLSF